MSLGSWIKGWRLDKFFKELFKSHTESGEISVKDSAQKVISVIDQTLAIWAQYEALFDSVVSDNAEASVEKIKSVIQEIRTKLSEVVTLPDIAQSLQEFRFADDDKRNAFYHSIISTAALAFSDGKISIFEAISFVTQIVVYVKESA